MKVRKMKYILILLMLSTAVIADECKWENEIPCITIANANGVSSKINPSYVITQKDIKKYNLKDINSVLTFVSGASIIQSGPRGQQSSLFLRGTNSNHTLVLLNGIPINDYSTPTGAFDFGQIFMSNISYVEVYKGSMASHLGADSIGGAVNLRTFVDFENDISVNPNGVNGSYTTSYNDWYMNVKGGIFESEEVSALEGGSEKDGTKNKSFNTNIYKWINHNLKFRTTLFARNTLTDIDGHNVTIEDGYSNNNMYAFQSGVDYITNKSKNYLTFHTHEYNRDYDTQEYRSNTHVITGEHKTKYYGIGFDYKHDASISKHEDHLGLFSNINYKILSLHGRKDEEHDSYKIGFIFDFFRLSHSTGFKRATQYTPVDESKLDEISFDYKDLTLSLFENEVNSYTQDGLELSYNIKDLRVFGSYINSKQNGKKHLRIPLWSGGLKYDWNNILIDYTYLGESDDIHNTNWSTIKQKEKHLLNLGYDYNGFTIGVTNLLDENYAPHGFNSPGKKFNLGWTKKF